MPENYIMKAEPGEFKIVPGGTGFIANTAAIVVQSITNPWENSSIQPEVEFIEAPRPFDPNRTELRLETTSPTPRKRPNGPAIPVSSHFKLVFLTVTGLTLLMLILQLAVAYAWGQSPNGFQSEVYSGLGLWKAGFGAIVGMLAGKKL